ncbi:MAG: DUF262 domain-containing protein [Aliarcobacter sp.]|nr:DUF262 domain-containing protein [Aliarcobacter sp.]
MNDLVFSTSMLFNTNNDNGCLKQIECDSFYIASYQRGYKWGDEPIQILFDDLYDAFKSSKNSKKSQEYYLQYITVKKIEYNKKKYLEIIDGQQRVTTLSILYSVLNNRDIIKNKIKYAVRSKVQEYIDNRIYKDYQLPSSWEALISEQEDYNEQDICYMYNAQSRFSKNKIEKLEDNDELTLFIEYLKHNVKIIVNLVEEHISSEQIFSNLNNNKIPLTNADLVKGLFLTKLARDNENNISFKEILEKRASIGRQWDDMENWLNQEEVKNYYFKDFNSSMDGFLKLFIKTLDINEKYNANEQYSIFNLIDKTIKKSDKSIIEIFHDFKLLYSRLVDWYDNTQIYNLLGFILLAKGSKSMKLVSFVSYIYKDKKEFIKSLNKAKNNIIEYEKMEELEYGKNNTSIHNILLALSIFDDDNSSRFNFNAYSDKKQNWSLEHIFPQTPKLDNGLLNCNDIKSINELSNNKDIEEFRNNIFLENKDINLDTEYKSLIKILEEGKAKKVTSTQILIIEELIKVESLHHIGNMALLSVGDNASMSNNMFNEKRLNLAKRVSKGSFIPKHTFDVFSKLTDFNQSNVMNENLKIWTLQDITTHQLWMKQRIEKIIGLEL